VGNYVGAMSSSLFDLSGHVALVTGGNGGIGLGFAHGLASAGAAVAVWGTNEAKNAAAVDELRAHGTQVAAFPCDVGDEGAVDAAFAATVEAFGKVDSCFANAGVSGSMPFTDMTLDEWRRVMRINLDGAFLTFRAAARHMVERGEGGSLVGTASVAALHGPARGEHYAATKAGLTAMVRGLAVEFGRHGIRANAVLPGWIETGMTEALFSWDRFREAALPRVPLRRWGVPADFSGIAVYLASPASAYHTGDTIVVDGGYTVF
jgi:NAD(P)-dependent dehydrogenase (short-subunit alcohol dehydrogenase family)